MAEVSDKKRLVALLLCLFLGGFGVQRFYVGKTGMGILTIVTLGGFLNICPLLLGRPPHCTKNRAPAELQTLNSFPRPTFLVE